jgi:hypothetical protein
VIKTPRFTPVMRFVFSEMEYNSTVAIKNAAMYVMLNGRLKVFLAPSKIRIAQKYTTIFSIVR